MNALTTKLAFSAAKSSVSSYAKKAQKEFGLEDEEKEKDNDWFGYEFSISNLLSALSTR